MIVTSKRVFINVLAQFMDIKALMEARYYIADVSNRSQNQLNFHKEVIYHDDGTQEIVNKPHVSSSISRFDIVYSDGWLDPTWAINQTTSNAIGSGSLEHQYEDPVKLYIKKLQEKPTIMGVRDWLYGRLTNASKPRGMRIIIINDEDIVKMFGHVMCSYLATFFGEDITFLDPKYRPQIVPGYVTYQGNKQFSNKLMRDLGDYELIQTIASLITQCGYDMSINNLTTFLSNMDLPTLFYVYEKLFPTEPLPAGNYAQDQIVRIIAGKCAEKLDVVYPQQRENALNTIDMYMNQIDAMLESEDLL